MPPTQCRLRYSAAGTSPRRLARIAGGLYLINIVFGAFAIGLVPAILIVPDVATTAHNIQTHELLYLFGLVAHVVVTVTNIPMAVIFYDLLKVVNRRLALLDVFFTLVATLCGGRRHPQPVHPASSSGQQSVFYGFDFICVAYLVLRSTFLPRAIGVLLAIDALAYLADGFANMIAPPWRRGTGRPRLQPGVLAVQGHRRARDVRRPRRPGLPDHQAAR